MCVWRVIFVDWHCDLLLFGLLISVLQLVITYQYQT